MRCAAQNKWVAVIIMLLLLCGMSACSEISPQITTTTITLDSYAPSVSNTKQISEDAPQVVYSNGKMYIYFPENPQWNNLSLFEQIANNAPDGYADLKNVLVCVENGTFLPVSKCFWMLGCHGDYIYYVGYGEGANISPLCAYNTKTTTITQLIADYAYNGYHDYDFTVDGLLRIRLKADDSTICYIAEDMVLGEFEDPVPPNTALLGENKYELRLYEYGRLYSNSGESTDLILESRNLSLHPTENGLVISDANAASGQIAYFIKPDGDVVPLFPEMEYDLMHSTLSVYGNYVFISFVRMQYWADWIPMVYNNDALSGTYRIDIRDLSATKISDQYFYSMFIFDDTGIFGSNASGIYKIDFDGNPLLTIVEETK